MTIHTKPKDTTIDMETLITIIFIIVDDWYQEKGVKLVTGKQGCKPVFSDREYDPGFVHGYHPVSKRTAILQIHTR